jgi:para-aminobenzoate synthetase component II
VKLLLIDNYDSFTFNLYQLFLTLGARVEVVKNDAMSAEDVLEKQPTHIVISPGPGTPDDAGVSNDVIRASAGRIPLLGVCLGHQCIAKVFTSGRNPVRRAPAPMHGKVSRIHHDGTGIMRGIPSPFPAARYHSLIVDALPPDFELMCWSTHPTLIMGHKTLPLFGVQFHPESFLTAHGKTIARNFLKQS